MEPFKSITAIFNTLNTALCIVRYHLLNRSATDNLQRPFLLLETTINNTFQDFFLILFSRSPPRKSQGGKTFSRYDVFNESQHLKEYQRNAGATLIVLIMMDTLEIHGGFAC